MKKIAFLYLLITSIVLFSQSIDSLIFEIKSQPPNQQLETLIDELWTYRSKNPTYAMKCGQRGIELAKELSDDSKLAEVNNRLGVIYRNIGNYTKALEFYNKALEIAKSVNDSVQIAYSFNNIGGAYRLERNYTIALANMFKALEIFEKLNMNEGVAFCTINIGIVYRHQGNYEKALNYFDRTIKIREELEDSFGLALVLNQVVEVYFDEGDFETALLKYDELYELYKELDDTKGIATVLGGIGGIHFEKSNYKKAMESREHALEIHRSIENLEGIINNLHGLALVYQKMNKPVLAKNAMREAEVISEQPGHTAFLISHYVIKSKYFENMNQPDSALFYFKKHCVFKDSLLARENMLSIASMEALYRVDLAAKENAILINENKLKSEQTTFLLILAVLLIAFLSFGIYKYYQNKNLNKELKELNATKDKFFSIVAHDLKNPFNNLLGYSELLADDYDGMTEDDRKQAMKDLHSSSKKLLALVENLLQWSSANIGSLQYNPQRLEVNSEINKLIELYSESTEQKRIKINTQVDPKLIAYVDQDYFNLVMRNLISNAIKFSSPDTSFDIIADDLHSFVKIKVQDYGVGIDEDKLKEIFELGSQKSTRGTMDESGTGLGLILAQDLVQRWGGDIQVQSQPGEGSVFTITIPKQ